jgi:hypothetical protein
VAAEAEHTPGPLSAEANIGQTDLAELHPHVIAPANWQLLTELE